ncbi:MAG: zf-TFIIB domain-containing protein [Deltaproteobacteria bacterium]|nr:zf-TFIIB domain-containing protein [Deltaproteobacteria bacterium]
MQCPKCRGSTRQVRANRGDPATGEAPVPTGDLELDRCGSCRGTWYDRRELDQLLGRDLSAEFGRLPTGTARRTACAQCGAPVAGPEPFCPGCGASLTAHCPRCEVELQSVRLVGVEIDFCPACGGLWLDESEVLALAAVFALRPDAPPGGLRCSRCGRSGLAPSQATCREDGLVCDACRLAARATRGELAPHHVPGPDIAAELLLDLVDTITDL